MTHQYIDKMKGLWYATVFHTRKNNHFLFYISGFPICHAQLYCHKGLEETLSRFKTLATKEQEYITRL